MHGNREDLTLGLETGTDHQVDGEEEEQRDQQTDRDEDQVSDAPAQTRLENPVAFVRFNSRHVAAPGWRQDQPNQLREKSSLRPRRNWNRVKIRMKAKSTTEMAAASPMR